MTTPQQFGFKRINEASSPYPTKLSYDKIGYNGIHFVIRKAKAGGWIGTMDDGTDSRIIAKGSFTDCAKKCQLKEADYKKELGD